MKAAAPAELDPAYVQGWLQKMGLRIAQIRESLHRNQNGVASDADIARQTLSALENGTN